MKPLPLMLLAAALALGCGSSRREEPLSGPLQLSDAQEVEGQRLFDRFCYQCHPNGQSGLGPALNNKPLPTATIKLQVRSGMGAMPPFSEKVINDEQLDAIAAYLLALRRADAP